MVGDEKPDEELGQADILLAVARCQALIYRATMAILKDDRADGLDASKWMRAHDKVFRKIANDCSGRYGMEAGTIEKAERIANGEES